MRRFGTAIVFCLTLALMACGGGNSTPNTLSGNWAATLSNSDGTGALAFTAKLTQTGQTVSVSNIGFTLSSTCFDPGTTADALATQIFTTHGVTSGNFQMTLQSGPKSTNGANTVSLQGTFTRQTISGTWSLTGTGTLCTPPENSTSGTFTMIPM